MGEFIVHLSGSGLARRDAILQDVLRASRSRGRRRRAARGVALVVPVIALAASVWGLRAVSAPSAAAPPRLPPVVVAPASPLIRVVQTQPGIAERWATRGSPASAERLDDDDLFLILKGDGRATGLIRAEGRVTVVGFEPDSPPRPSGLVPGEAGTAGRSL